MKKIKIAIKIIPLLLLLLLSCKNSATQSTATEDSDAKGFNNPVLKGDFADPSIVRVGDSYWATATSSAWAPLFPILHSTNLQDWEIKSHVFPDQLPEWAESRFWAPEIVYDKGTYFIYYTAKKKAGPLCVGVAKATNPEGPYTDLGPIVCQDVGAIDGFQIRDDSGKLYLIWKEDGNSRQLPTPLWGQEMNEARTALVGDRFELFRNDRDTWEGKLVEGAALVKKNGYYYTFYSGDACCGPRCSYGIGVARARNLKGPWEKYEKNPIKKENDEWQCAGHGTMVQDKDGHYYFLYHAYNKKGTVYTGRQGLISEVIWDEETGWPEFKDESPSYQKVEKEQDHLIEEDFSSASLSPYWQWPITSKPQYTITNKKLHLQATDDKIGSVLAQRITTPHFEASVNVKIPAEGTEAGIAAIGDVNKALGISVNDQEIVVWKRKGGEKHYIHRLKLKENTADITLKLSSTGGDRYSFYWEDASGNWQELGDANTPVKGGYLPPWDRAVRVGLTAKGKGTAVYDDFKFDAK